MRRELLPWLSAVFLAFLLGGLYLRMHQRLVITALAHSGDGQPLDVTHEVLPAEDDGSRTIIITIRNDLHKEVVSRARAVIPNVDVTHSNTVVTKLYYEAPDSILHVRVEGGKSKTRLVVEDFAYPEHFSEGGELVVMLGDLQPGEERIIEILMLELQDH